MCYTMKQKHFYSSGPCAGLCAVTCTGSHAQVLETLTEGTRTGISKDHHLVSMKKCNPYQAPRPRFLACKWTVTRLAHVCHWCNCYGASALALSA